MFSLRGTLIIISGAILNVLPCAALFRTQEEVKPKQEVTEAVKAPLIVEIPPDIERNSKVSSTECSNSSDSQQNKHHVEDVTTMQKHSEKDESIVEIEIKTYGRNFHKFIYHHTDCDDSENKDAVSEPGVIDRHCKLFRNRLVCIFYFSQLFFLSGFLIPFIYVPDKAKEHGKH